jgi:hypothetical protein
VVKLIFVESNRRYISILHGLSNSDVHVYRLGEVFFLSKKLIHLQIRFLFEPEKAKEIFHRFFSIRYDRKLAKIICGFLSLTSHLHELHSRNISSSFLV